MWLLKFSTCTKFSSCRPVLEKRTSTAVYIPWTRKPVKSAVPVPVKVPAYSLFWWCLGWKNHEKYDLRSTRFGIHHACMHENWDAARDSNCMHARTSMSWPAVSKELLAAKYARVAPRCRTAWPLCWPQTALRQRRSSCSLCKTALAPEVPRLKQALLSRF